MNGPRSYLLERLKQIDEAGSSLLDNSLLCSARTACSLPDSATQSSGWQICNVMHRLDNGDTCDQ